MSNGTITKHDGATFVTAGYADAPLLDLLRAMGHANGSGATEEFTNVPGFASFLNAANFGDPADSDETKINAAIVAAKAAGKHVMVPLSMQPYDASLVTFNTGVHMVREGGNPTLDEHDTAAYGVDPLGVIDGYAGLQAIFDAHAVGSTGDSRTMRVVGKCRYNTPLWVSAQGTRIVGNYQTDGTLFQGGFGASTLYSGTRGVGVLVAGSSADVNGLTTSLVTGSGNAFGFTSFSGPFWNLRDILDLNGLAQFCVECFAQTTYRADNGTLVHSMAIPLQNDAISSAFFLNTDGFVNGGCAEFSLTVGGVTHTLQAPDNTATDGAVHHLAGTYDGATVRLFVDGALVDSEAATGTVTQTTYEGIFVGPDRTSNEQSPWSQANATLDSVRLSNTARYTSAFTAPTAKLTVDANTLALLNWDSQRGPMTRVQTKDGDAWIAQRGGVAANCYGFKVSGVLWDHVNTNCVSSVYLYSNAEFWSMEHVAFNRQRIGIHGSDLGNKFQWRLASAEFRGNGNTPARMGLFLGTFGGIGNMEKVWFWGDNRIPMLFCIDRIALTNVWVNTNTNTECGLLCNAVDQSGSPLVLNQFNVNTESGTATAYRGALLLSGILKTHGVVMSGGCLECGSAGEPLLIADATDVLEFHGVNFRKLTRSPASVMATQGTLRQPALFQSCDQPDGWIPWSDTAGTSTVGKLGKLSAVAYSATPTFDCSVRDEFEITLTGDCAPTITNVTPGQSILVTIIQDGSGAHGFTWPANVKGGGTVSATGGSVNQQRFTAMLDSATNPTLMADAAMVSV